MALSDVDVCQWALEGNIYRLQEALKVNPELANKTDQSHRTPLHWAASGGQEEITSLLLKYNSFVSLVSCCYYIMSIQVALL